MEITGLQGKVKLNNGVEMPYFGLGTWQSEGSQVKSAVHYALDAGYRLIDTATLYHNEKSIGEALKENGIKREELFLTTKLWNDDQGYEKALKAYDHSLKLVGLDLA